MQKPNNELKIDLNNVKKEIKEEILQDIEMIIEEKLELNKINSEVNLRDASSMSKDFHGSQDDFESCYMDPLCMLGILPNILNENPIQKENKKRQNTVLDFNDSLDFYSQCELNQNSKISSVQLESKHIKYKCQKYNQNEYFWGKKNNFDVNHYNSVSDYNDNFSTKELEAIKNTVSTFNYSDRLRFALISYKCPECNFLICSRRCLEKHEILHSTKIQVLKKGIYQCSKCCYTGRTLTLLKRHEISHRVKKRFQCSKCNFSTNLILHLKNHNAIHNGTSCFKCCYGSFGSKLKNKLKRYKKIHKNQLKAKLASRRSFMKCSLCKFSTSSFSSLLKHHLSHSKTGKVNRSSDCDFKIHKSKDFGLVKCKIKACEHENISNQFNEESFKKISESTNLQPKSLGIVSQSLTADSLVYSAVGSDPLENKIYSKELEIANHLDEVVSEKLINNTNMKPILEEIVTKVSLKTSNDSLEMESKDISQTDQEISEQNIEKSSIKSIQKEIFSKFVKNSKELNKISLQESKYMNQRNNIKSRPLEIVSKSLASESLVFSVRETDSHEIKNSLKEKESRISQCKPKLLKCDHCDYTTPFKRILVRHKLSHERKKTFHCSKYNLQHKPKLFKCDHCDYTTPFKRILVRHKLSHERKKTFHCSKYNLQHKPKLFKCDHCDYTTPFKRILARHKLSHDRKMFHCSKYNLQYKPKLLKCDDCDYTTPSKQILVRHKLSHGRKMFHCSKYNLQYKPKLLKCDDCDYTTPFKRILVRHKLSHGRKMMFHCSKYNLQYKPKLLKCDDCDYTTPFKRILVRHKLSHSRKKTFHCSKCTLSTNTEYLLLKHEKSKHSGDLHTTLSKIKNEFVENKSQNQLPNINFKDENVNLLKSDIKSGSGMHFDILSPTPNLITNKCVIDRNPKYEDFSISNTQNKLGNVTNINENFESCIPDFKKLKCPKCQSSICSERICTKCKIDNFDTFEIESNLSSLEDSKVIFKKENYVHVDGGKIKGSQNTQNISCNIDRSVNSEIRPYELKTLKIILTKL